MTEVKLKTAIKLREDLNKLEKFLKQSHNGMTLMINNEYDGASIFGPLLNELIPDINQRIRDKMSQLVKEFEQL